jgi:hypothetical protein
MCASGLPHDEGQAQRWRNEPQDSFRQPPGHPPDRFQPHRRGGSQIEGDDQFTAFVEVLKLSAQNRQRIRYMLDETEHVDDVRLEFRLAGITFDNLDPGIRQVGSLDAHGITGKLDADQPPGIRELRERPRMSAVSGPDIGDDFAVQVIEPDLPVLKQAAIKDACRVYDGLLRPLPSERLDALLGL